MIEAELDAPREKVGDFFAIGRSEAFVDDIAAEREWQAILRLPPPDAKVFAEVQALVAVSELAFVNDEADVGTSMTDGGEDFVEGNDDEIEFGGFFFQPELEREKRAGHFAGDGDAFFGDFFFGECFFG